jgi:hypothetical protein
VVRPELADLDWNQVLYLLIQIESRGTEARHESACHPYYATLEHDRLTLKRILR